MPISGFFWGPREKLVALFYMDLLFPSIVLVIAG
jgi:hypothetical protein